MAQIKLEQFEGPLDLLLSLTEQQKLNITEIALAEVTEQFLQHVKNLDQINPTSLADFLSIAAKLLVIKSKAILPSLEIEQDEDILPEEDLAEKLIIYKQFKDVAKKLRAVESRALQSFTRNLVFSQRIYFWPDPNVNAATLASAAKKVVKSLEELSKLPKARVKEVFSIQQKIRTLQATLSSQVQTKLSELFSSAKNKQEVIVTFLALLELIKQRFFTAEQNDLFDEVVITKYQSTIIS